MREICYQRMLIEQRTDIHLSVARLMQNAKFSYISHEKEMYMLKKHLRITEKSIINYMEDDDNLDEVGQNFYSLSNNNMKLVIVNKICEKLKLIQFRLDDHINRMNPLIKCGAITKKSSKNITWEE